MSEMNFFDEPLTVIMLANIVCCGSGSTIGLWPDPSETNEKNILKNLLRQPSKVSDHQDYCRKYLKNEQLSTIHRLNQFGDVDDSNRSKSSQPFPSKFDEDPVKIKESSTSRLFIQRKMSAKNNASKPLEINWAKQWKNPKYGRCRKKRSTFKEEKEQQHRKRKRRAVGFGQLRQDSFTKFVDTPTETGTSARYELCQRTVARTPKSLKRRLLLQLQKERDDVLPAGCNEVSSRPRSGPPTGLKCPEGQIELLGKCRRIFVRD